jgi:hypothetical protein
MLLEWGHITVELDIIFKFAPVSACVWDYFNLKNIFCGKGF